MLFEYFTGLHIDGLEDDGEDDSTVPLFDEETAEATFRSGFATADELEDLLSS